MKTVWNLIGTNFTHTSGGHTGLAGTHGKLAEKVEWSFNFEGVISFYLDGHMFTRKNDPPNHRKFGWFLESKSIRPEITKRITEQYESLFETYELIFTHNASLLALDNRFKFTICCGSWIKDYGIHPKSKLVSAISSGKDMCEGHKWRNNFIEKHLGKFDLFGNKYHHLPLKEKGLNDYMFSVCIENGSYSSYFSEKILDCFATGTIPIYRGSPDIGNFFNLDGIILIDENFTFEMLTESFYFSKMEAIKDNFERVSNITTAEDFMFDNYGYILNS